LKLAALKKYPEFFSDIFSYIENLNAIQTKLKKGNSKMINRKFWKPSVTSQFKVCPVPYHMDTYRGCTYGCLFCFARDFIQFARRNSEHKAQYYI